LIITILLVAATSLITTQSEAQSADPATYGWEVGPHVLVSFPQSDFANVSSTGGGLGIKVTRPLWGLSWLGLRGDFGYVTFGSDQRSANLGGFLVLLQTRNESFRLSVGPQVRIRVKRFQFYGAANGGVFNYRTVVSIPSYYTYPYTETTDSLTRLGWGVGGGLLYDLGFGPWIDIGLQYLTIRNAVSTEVSGTKISSDANEVNLTIGVMFFLK
jgi:opacity protein-like surface antigen